MKRILPFILAFISLMACSRKTNPPPIVVVSDEEIFDEIFTVVEEMPRFPGCENQGLSEKKLKVCSERNMYDFVYRNRKYPQEAASEGIEGTVNIRFTIQKDGSIENIEIAKDIGYGCGEAAKRIVEKMPKWIPGKHQGNEVHVYYSLPVNFHLE